MPHRHGKISSSFNSKYHQVDNQDYSVSHSDRHRWVDTAAGLSQECWGHGGPKDSPVSHQLVPANTANECLNPGLPSFCLIQKVYFTDNIALIKKKIGSIQNCWQSLRYQQCSFYSSLCNRHMQMWTKIKSQLRLCVRCSAVFSSLHFLLIF